MRHWVVMVLLLALIAPYGASAAQGGTPGASPMASPSAESGYANPDLLVDTAWIEEHRDDPEVRIVALTPEDDFQAGHIPNAAQIDWPALKVVDTSNPSIERWQQEVESELTALGLAPDQTIVIYDGGTLFAARLWWVLKQLGHEDARILNGGLPAYKEAGGELEEGAAHIQPVAETYQSDPQPALLATLDEVMASLDEPNVALVDARTPEEYANGHIPGAVNINFPRNAEPDVPKYWKPADELLALYASYDVTPDKQVIPYCATGVRSAVTYFTLRLLVYDDVALYTGSWDEWGDREDTPKVTGNEPR